MSLLNLLADLRSGRNVREGQEELYLLLRKELLTALRSHLPERIQSRVDPEDILHEALLRALKGLDRFEFSTEKAFVAWVYRISRNLMLDQVKRRSAAALSFDPEPGGNGLRESRLPSRERAIESRLQKSDWIESSLDRLAEREADVIRLHLLRGRSFQEIGSEWGKKPATIKRLYSLALQHLREVTERRQAE
jgi:RNA polymerase sigma factor (sigma-70 family)